MCPPRYCFDEDTPERLIRKVRPDVLVKGGDYGVQTIVGAEFVQSYGGEVFVVELVSGHSSSRLIALNGNLRVIPQALRQPIPRLRLGYVESLSAKDEVAQPRHARAREQLENLAY